MGIMSLQSPLRPWQTVWCISLNELKLKIIRKKN
jgi:hypothetical protein